MVPRENKSNPYAKFGGTNKEHYGIFRSGLLATFKNTIILLVPPKFCIRIAFIFSWVHSKSQEKMKTMFMQNFGGTKKEYYGIFESGLFTPYVTLVRAVSNTDATLRVRFEQIEIDSD